MQNQVFNKTFQMLNEKKKTQNKKKKRAFNARPGPL